jgi:hypothetical protein
MRQWPDEQTRTSKNACLYQAEVVIDGKRYSARSRRGAPFALARVLVAAGVLDQPVSLICGRLRERKKNLGDGIARSQVLTSVRPLLRPFICRGPVWEFADRVHITPTRSRRSVKNWLPDPVSH